MQFKSYHWLSHHGLWTIMPCFTNNYGKDTLYAQFFWALLFTFWSSFLYFKDFFNKIIIPLAVVRGNSVPCYLSTATFHIQCTLVEYSVPNYQIDIQFHAVTCTWISPITWLLYIVLLKVHVFPFSFCLLKRMIVTW